ncbi:hypothetical protein IW261DRAFT_646773 [Armillaria novae-zelandiae]|uniref:Uncharacterized protein n=1 Tax=Armillaria novae-zelandiae TaxID=153914 RepID=A0AA39ULG5_9AGAR|nr:hypothetical protein IW261DRAFT_646773 [Armillaria novae-zelandiae]
MIRGLPPQTVDLQPFSVIPLLFTTINRVKMPLPPRRQNQTWTTRLRQLLTIKLHHASTILTILFAISDIDSVFLGSGIRSTRDDAGDRESDDQLKEGVDAPEAPSGYRADKTGSIEDSDLGIDAPVSNDNTGDGSGGREDGSAQSHRDDNVRPDSHTTPDAQPLPSEETSSTLNDKQQGEVTTSAPRADMDNGGSSSFDDQPSVGEYHSPDDSQQYRDTTDTTGKGPGSRDDNSDHGGLRHEGSYRGSSQGQDASSNINAPTEDVDNSNFDKQNKDKQTGSDTASDTSGQDVGSKREDTSNTSDRSTSGADQPPDTIRYSSEREDNKPYVDDRAGAGAGAGYDHSGYGGYAASTGYRVGGKPGLKDKLRGNAEVLVGRAAKKPELVERGLERKAGNVV